MADIHGVREPVVIEVKGPAVGAGLVIRDGVSRTVNRLIG
jgi:hypothetical protein